MTVVRYDAATGPSGGPAPGAIALRDHWRKTTGLPDNGIYNPRKIRGAKGWSIHAEGRAVDGTANAHDPAQRAKADRYCQFLIDNAAALNLQYLIWNRRSWKSGRGWATYTGASPHTDHVHAELNRDGARTVTAALLNALWSEWIGDHDQPATTPQEDNVKPSTLVILTFGAYIGRPPSMEEIGRWVNEYENGGGEDAVVSGIVHSDEAKARREAKR